MSLNINPSLPTFLITHANCPDGSACAVFAKQKYPNLKTVFALHNSVNVIVQDTVKQLDQGGVLLIADIVCDEDILNKICMELMKLNVFIGIYEHHKSRDWLETYKLPAGISGEVIFDNKRCGSKILYDALVKGGSDNLSNYLDFSNVINDRDLWLNKDDRGILMAKLHHIYGDESFVDRFLKNEKATFTKEESVLIDFVAKQENDRIENELDRIQILKDDSGYDYGIIYCSGESSDLLNAAIERFNLEYAIMLDLNRNKGSIRGLGNMDCSEFASSRGGGGHRCASGFPISVNRPEI
ncbi:MAG: hypothetical protein COA79_11085 [Planctomycetota bacterium]|nr:MAG: hypothetical protein COA79_11085 [Planctomycetota bacterium]